MQLIIDVTDMITVAEFILVLILIVVFVIAVHTSNLNVTCEISCCLFEEEE